MNEEIELHKKELEFYKPSLKSFITGYESWYMGNYIRFLRLSEKYDKSKGFRKVIEFFAKRAMRHYGRKTGFQIELHAIGPGLKIYHWGPIIVNGHAKIGSDFTIFPGCTVGRKGEGYPKIGNNCVMGLGSIVYGNISIGNNVIIAPNSVVTKSFPDNCIIGGIPARIIKFRNDI